MPRPDPIPAVTATMFATVWGLTTLATLLAVDPGMIAWNSRLPCSLTGLLGVVGALLEPAWLLTGLVLVVAGAALARTGRLGALARRQSPGLFRAACGLLKAGLAATAAALLLKALIGRARPAGDHGWLIFDPFTADAAFQSAPSAHAALAGALVATAISRWPRGTWIWLAFGFLAGGDAHPGR